MRDLRFGRKGPAKGQAKSLLVFLHGYGANGADLLGLADVMGPHLPGVAFVAPDAPEQCRGGGFGFQWFPVPWIDGSAQGEADAGLDASTGDLNAFLDARLQDEGLTADRLVLVGFSQGSMMLMHVAPRRDKEVAGIVAISGRLLRPERLVAEVRVKPPVLLMHGDQDPVVPFSDMAKAGDALVAAGFPTFGHVMKGTGHGIAPDGVGMALNFIRDRLGIAG